MDRQLSGYLILAAVAVALAGFWAFKAYHSRDRMHARREKKEWTEDAREKERRPK